MRPLQRRRDGTRGMKFTTLMNQCSQKPGSDQRKLVFLATFCCLAPQIRVHANPASTGFHGTLPSSPWKENDLGSPESSAGSILPGTPSSDEGESELESSSDFEDEVDVEPSSQVHATGKAHPEDEAHVVEGIPVDPQEDADWPEAEDEESSDAEESDDETFAVSRSSVSDGESMDGAVSSQPLKTLEKLQQMLDETDYMTESPGLRYEEGTTDEGTTPSPILDQTMLQPVDSGAASTAPIPQRHPGDKPPPKTDRLWTSKDRMKYKKQQERLRRAKKEQRRLEKQIRSSPPVHPNSSDDDAEASDTDDGLGYTLPNLPVYYSDTEGTTDMTDGEPPTGTVVQHGTVSKQPPPPFAQRAYYPYPPQAFSPYNTPPSEAGQHPPPYISYPPSRYHPYSQAYGSYSPQQQQLLASQQYAAWAAATGVSPYGATTSPMTHPYHALAQGQFRRKSPGGRRASPARVETSSTPSSDRQYGQSDETQPVPSALMDTSYAPPFSVGHASQSQLSIPHERTNQLNFDSVQKLFILGVCIASLAYCAVSPRNLPTVQYNFAALNNLKIISFGFIAPMIYFSLVVDTRENDINTSVNTFYTSATVGYFFAFVLELMLTTIVRLGVFTCWEPEVFNLTPKVPALSLPWVLRENGYRPRRITLFAADFATSCLAGPIVEEYVKLKMLQLSVRLPRNFRWTIKQSSKTKRRRRVAEDIHRSPGDPPVTNVNSYVAQMLAASIGLKMCDTMRRILMYTKKRDADKEFFALCRGIFPIQELCGTMTALALAKRDVLGVNMPLWKMLFPAVVIHGMANFRGMKPIFKWNSSMPWSEMQLSPLHTADALTRPQIMKKAFPKLMWLIILARVAGYCAKNYFLIRRQAMKRTTTYAGKHSAFSAELAAAEALKNTKE